MELLQPLIGKKITVVTVLGGGQEKQEVGTLEAAAGDWLQLRKGEHEVHIYPLSHIRMIKPFEPL